MPPVAYYNEIDPFAAQWLRNLIAAGHIAPGEVDERSILDVCPDDLVGFTQCHFFAGVGVWSYALRRAGWLDSTPVWTGSCPCQPFSVAGVGGGFDDERHLWPFWFHLIEQFRPVVVFGEQVEAAIRHDWLDLVQADMEGVGYAFAPVGVPAAGVGAPHIRQRLWFVGYADDEGLEGFGCGHQTPRGRVGALRPVAEAGESGGLGYAECERSQGRSNTGSGENVGQARPQPAGASADDNPGPINGFWSDADWLLCRDGKWRPVEPGTFPLAHGAPARVGRLRAYGNAINAEVATEIIRAFMECRP